MPRTLSLTMRSAANAAQSLVTPVVFVTITHADLDAPVRLSSDPTERLSSDPLRYGTRHLGDIYDFVLMSALLPDDKEGALPVVTLAFENVAANMASVARAVLTPATVDLKVVLASSPDSIEEQYLGLQAAHVVYDKGRITLDITRETIFTRRPWPAGRMTQARFPGLFP
jgi:hypothetical protein